MEIEQLTALDAMWDKGTNLHHALLLANRHFRKHPNAQPVLLIVTDGEPTSHLEPDGEVYFSYPPHPLTVASPCASSTTPAASAPRRRSSGSVTTRAGPLRRLDGRTASTAGSSRPSSTTSALPSSAPTSVRGRGGSGGRRR